MLGSFFLKETLLKYPLSKVFFKSNLLKPFALSELKLSFNFATKSFIASTTYIPAFVPELSFV